MTTHGSLPASFEFTANGKAAMIQADSHYPFVGAGHDLNGGDRRPSVASYVATAGDQGRDHGPRSASWGLCSQVIYPTNVSARPSALDDQALAGGVTARLTLDPDHISIPSPLRTRGR